MTDSNKYLIVDEDGSLLSDELSRLLAEYDSAPIQEKNKLYTKLSQVAKNLIRKYGGKAQLVRYSTVERPWEGGEAEEFRTDIVAVIFPVSEGLKISDTIRSGLFDIYVAAENVDIHVRDHIVMAGKTYYITEILTYEPNGFQRVLYHLRGGQK